MWQAMTWESPHSSGEQRSSAAAEQSQLARLRRQVDDRWRTLALANERGASAEALERLYDGYMRAVDAYVARQRTLTRPTSDWERRAS